MAAATGWPGCGGRAALTLDSPEVAFAQLRGQGDTAKLGTMVEEVGQSGQHQALFGAGCVQEVADVMCSDVRQSGVRLPVSVSQ
jgi:hypothetical protein